ncbi:CobW family GTP-binding protein [Gynuella sunshinyii]|uniref:Putative GTPase (G3E family) n=1 Tax=Gynuella sunshinyii YC6258 TaxID=1445510 RepID=A0A0C5VRY2_9GAMM|nr:GTP-binding protein [Gynuella sunshinyii]AJQ93029.1 putative GTPase (G3E family) [Gynuella sunshinyii YC6258]
MSKLIPTNVITGFLGAGKTTVILELLKNRPTGERWAVLINEFGEIGIDAGIVQSLATDPGQLHIREVPGGCMCCTAGLPMQVALNQLIRQARPDRLLIEPTGLGHPREILATLHGRHYIDVLDIRATLTLVDARRIADSRYASHEIFRQQLEVADVVVASKADLYADGDLVNLKTYLQQLRQVSVEPVPVSLGVLPQHWLERPHAFHSHDHHHHHDDVFAISAELPDNGVLLRRNHGSGYHSIGWVFDRRYQFDQEALASLFMALDVERLKAVVRTDRGGCTYNLSDGVLSMNPVLNELEDSRIECLAEEDSGFTSLQQQLESCLTDGAE